MLNLSNTASLTFVFDLLIDLLQHSLSRHDWQPFLPVGTVHSGPVSAHFLPVRSIMFNIHLCCFKQHSTIRKCTPCTIWCVCRILKVEASTLWHQRTIGNDLILFFRLKQISLSGTVAGLWTWWVLPSDHFLPVPIYTSGVHFGDWNNKALATSSTKEKGCQGDERERERRTEPNKNQGEWRLTG